MRVVLDTNVLVSGLILPDSVPGRIVRAWQAVQFNLVLSEPMLAEVRRVLAYRKIRTRLRWDESTVRRYDLLLRFETELVDVSKTNAHVPADPDDGHVLATLIAAQAECLVTGDKGLPALRDCYPILTPAQFAQRL